jgi:hypothetical protein
MIEEGGVEEKKNQEEKRRKIQEEEEEEKFVLYVRNMITLLYLFLFYFRLKEQRSSLSRGWNLSARRTLVQQK